MTVRGLEAGGVADVEHLRDPIPEGFVDPRVGGFAGNLGPILRREREGGPVSGFLVETRHCNPYASCHGGWLSTFADIALVRVADDGAGRWVTAGLLIDFLRPVPLGAWVESDCIRLPQGARSCTVRRCRSPNSVS